MIVIAQIIYEGDSSPLIQVVGVNVTSGRSLEKTLRNAQVKSEMIDVYDRLRNKGRITSIIASDFI
ncbi:hypothetical protein O999_23135 [Pseudomonas putida LF54]|nr:hypothetical protein O999_23135 [Pseudomonas putida LF54]